MVKKLEPTSTLQPTRSPIVAVLGHVDHGKTTLLDTIRKSDKAAHETGGITQHIGAYQIKIKDQKSPPKADRPLAEKIKNEDEKSITFIDTPGHEAFLKMRARGASIADIAVLVVAATDGVQPQTLESIEIIKKTEIPMVVAINKIDLPEADPEKIKRQLAQHDVLVEGFGGDIVVVPISAKTGEGVPQLLEVLLLVAEMKEIKTDTTSAMEAVVVEAKRDNKRGIVATVIVKNGTLKIGDTIYAENIKARIRALISDTGEMVTIATPSTPVEILGWEAVPQVGTIVTPTPQMSTATAPPKKNYSFELPPLETATKLKIILKTDVAGSQEAILANVGDLVELVYASTGEIGESDVLTAKSTGAFIIGFNVKIGNAAAKLATVEKVRVKVYRIIYELLEEVAEVIELLNQPEAQEQELGTAQIMAEFRFGEERVAGCKVTGGRVVRNDLIKLLRGEEEVSRGRIKSLRTGKTDAPKVEAGSECGMVFDKKLDFRVGDHIIAYKLHELLT